MPGGVRLQRRGVTELEQVSGGQLHAQEPAVGRVAGGREGKEGAAGNGRSPDDGEVEPAKAGGGCPAGQAVTGRDGLALQGRRHLGGSKRSFLSHFAQDPEQQRKRG